MIGRRPPRRAPSADSASADEDSFLEEGEADQRTRGAALPALWVGKRRSWFLWLVSNSLMQALLALAIALLARATVDGPEASAVGLTFAGLATALLMLAALRRQEAVQAETLAQHYIAEVRLALFDTLATLSPVGRQRRSRGGVMLRFVGDAQALRAWVGFGLAHLAAAAFAWLALLAGLALLEPVLAMFALVWTVLAGAGMLWTLPRVERAVRTARLRQAYIAANIHDKIAALPVMQSAAQTGRERRRLQRQNERLADAMRQRAAAHGRHHLVLDMALSGLALSVVTALLLDSASLGGLHLPGSTGTLIGAVGLIGLLTAPLRRIGRALEQRVAADVARERISEFLADAEPREPDTRQRVSSSAVLRFDGVRVQGRLDQAVDGEIPARRRVALVGPAGSGKSTLLELAARLQAPTEGVLELGGLPLSHIGTRQFSRRVSFLSPDTPALRGTVGCNLRYRMPKVAPADLALACQLAGWTAPLDDEGLSRRVRDGGSNLTGQERRALTLARALVGRPSLLLIDDIERCLPSPVADSLQRLLADFKGTLVYSTGDALLSAMADECWLLDPSPTPAPPPATPDATRPVGLRVVGGHGAQQP